MVSAWGGWAGAVRPHSSLLSQGLVQRSPWDWAIPIPTQTLLTCVEFLLRSSGSRERPAQGDTVAVLSVALSTSAGLWESILGVFSAVLSEGNQGTGPMPMSRQQRWDSPRWSFCLTSLWVIIAQRNIFENKARRTWGLQGGTGLGVPRTLTQQTAEAEGQAGAPGSWTQSGFVSPPSRPDTGGMTSAALSLRLVAGGQSSVPRAYRAG